MVVGSQLPVLLLLNVLLTQVHGWQVLGVLRLCWEVVALEDLGVIAAPPRSLRKPLFELCSFGFKLAGGLVDQSVFERHNLAPGVLLDSSIDVPCRERISLLLGNIPLAHV
mgnify:CR=1 FL=1